MIKNLLKKYFKSLAYFYSHLKYRIFVVISFSILIGVLDGFGLTMFLPLLQMVNDSSAIDPDSLGKLKFLVVFIEDMGISLNLVSILGMMTIFFIGKGLIQYISGIYQVNVQQWFIKKMRIQNIKGLNRLAYKYFVISDVGRIQNTLTGEVGRVANAYISYFTALQYGVLVLVYMGFAFFIDMQFAILVTVGGVLTNFLYKNLYKNTKGISRTLTGENSVFQGLIIQNVANYKYLKATGSLKKYEKKLEESILKIEVSNRKIGQLDALLTSGREPILIGVVVLVIYIQTTFLGSELGPILISLIFFYRALNYLMQMQVRWNKYLSVSGSLENVQIFGNELKENKEVQGTISLNESIEKIEIKDAYFYYNQSPVLKNISLDIYKHETIAFVGESGSGKTTLVNIIAGLLPIEKGSYKINNINVKDINVRSLQERIGYITQDPVIFNDTIFNNITFWGEETNINKDLFWNAVKQAAIFDFVNELPEKENTILGNNGVNLSGGQRQRISIARELYKNIEILILDEATSALDSETEKAIQKNIEELKGNYTILIVAHRISTIKNADRIMIINNGEIDMFGTFNELQMKSPYFKKLVDLQEL